MLRIQSGLVALGLVVMMASVNASAQDTCGVMECQPQFGACRVYTGECLNSTCLFNDKPAGVTCSTDSDPYTIQECNGSGSCRRGNAGVAADAGAPDAFYHVTCRFLQRPRGPRRLANTVALTRGLIS